MAFFHMIKCLRLAMYSDTHAKTGDKNSTHLLVITSEIEKGRVILPKALVL